MTNDFIILSGAKDLVLKPGFFVALLLRMTENNIIPSATKPADRDLVSNQILH